MKYTTKILNIEDIAQDVKRFTLKKPSGFKFIPGQASSVSINDGKWKSEERPFTFTSLNEDPILEFMIKQYPDHNGVTKKLHELKIDDELILSSPHGTIKYSGKGVFIAGGAGITPFIAILRQLRKENKIEDNKLFFTNKKSKDVILEKEFKEMFRGKHDNLVLTLTRENNFGYQNKRIDENFLKERVKDFKQNFYVCGPKIFVKEITAILKKLGANPKTIIFEK